LERGDRSVRSQSDGSDRPGPRKDRTPLGDGPGGYGKAKAKLDELKDAAEDTFDNAKGEAEHVWKALRQSVKYFRSQL